ncbi:hypothetical protein FQN54_005158 [Arachnomyces sp. PD_36]|nr:hypothetical protein FQN54_005158 [Arachnomyces sp. PD_36]
MDSWKLGLLAGICIGSTIIIIINVVVCWKVVERPAPAVKPIDTERPVDPPVKRVRFASTVQLLLPRSSISINNLKQHTHPYTPHKRPEFSTDVLLLRSYTYRATTIEVNGTNVSRLCDSSASGNHSPAPTSKRTTNPSGTDIQADQYEGGGKSATVQYAKTWHGWTELTKHEERQKRRKDWFKRLRNCLSWKSTHADYNWVYWDPARTEINRHYEDQRGIRWLPRWLLSYDFQMFNTIRTTRSLTEDRDLGTEGGATTQVKGEGVSASKEPVLIPEGNRASWELHKRNHASTLRRRRPASSRIRPPVDGVLESADVPTSSEDMTSRPPGEPATFPWKRSCSMPPFSSASHDQSFMTARSHQLTSAEHPREDDRHRIAGASLPSRVTRGNANYQPSRSQSAHIRKGKWAYDEKTLSWRYKAWGARMQLDSFDQTRNFRGYAGRPGSPNSDMLKGALSSGEGTDTSGGVLATHRTDHRTSASTSALESGSSTAFEHNAATQPRSRYSPAHTATPSGRCELVNEPSAFYTEPSGAGSELIHASTSHAHAGPSSRFRKISPSSSSESESSASPQKDTERCCPSRPKPRPSQRRLSSPEVRLIYNLGRRLEWLSNELDPGRKPFHFLILANHWLNRKTWFVLDPSSRVPETNKRLHGDPRAIRSRGTSPGAPRKVKYPNVARERAYTPRIDSWRLSVNRVRKSSGMREFLKSIELFDSSAEEPPDNAIDTASWVLRKPPQGFEMSTKQKTAYYNSGTGWYETLTDWQKVQRAYRVRKLIHEGRVNRTRVKEVALGIGSVCQRVARRATPDWHAFSPNHENNRLVRKERSGNGSIPLRGGQRGIFRRPGLPERYLSAQTIPDHSSAQLQHPSPIDPGGGMMGTAESGAHVVLAEHQEQRDTG